MTSKSLLLILPTMWCTLCHSQSSLNIQQRIEDESKKGIPFVNAVLIRTSDSTILSTTVSDSQGMCLFTCKSQETDAVIKASAIGYKPLVSQPFKLNGNVMKLPPLTMEFTSVLLKGIIVAGKSGKPAIERDAEKMTIHVDGMNTGNSTYDLLSNSPGVIYDRAGMMSINGRPGTRVMVDGKLLHLSGSDLDNYLKTLNLSSVRDVEIISNPSSKYDAEGTGGLVNIIMKSGTDQGYTGTVTTGYTQGRYAKFSNAVTATYKQKKITLGINFSRTDNKTYEDDQYYKFIRDNNNQTVFNQQIYSRVLTHGNILGISGDYDFDKRNSLGIYLRSTLYNESIAQFNTNQISASQRMDSTLISDNLTTNKLRNTNINVNFIHKIDTSGTSYTINLDHTFYRNYARYGYHTLYYNELSALPYDELNLNSAIPNRIAPSSIKLDFNLPLNKTSRIEAGIKAAYTDSRNDIIYDNNNTDIHISLPIENSAFEYNEHVEAIYLTYKSGNKKFHYAPGMRLETTSGKGSGITDISFTRNYTNLFPNLMTDYIFNKHHTISLSVGRRIQRPNFRDLNPFTYLVDPYFYLQGNEALKAQFSTYAELTYTINNKYFITGVAGKTTNYIMQVPHVDSQLGTTTLIKQNMGNYENVGATVYAPFGLNKWWNGSLNMQYYYRKFEALVYKDTYNNNGSSFRATLLSNVTINKKYVIDINGFYQSATVQGVYKTDDYTNLNLGLRRTFKSMDIKILWSDILGTYKLRNRYSVENQEIDLRQRFDTRTVGITLTYKFTHGSTIKASSKKNPATEEQQRL